MRHAREADLEALVLRILREHPLGLGEFEMIRRLRAEGRSEFESFSDKLALFRAHFLLFHVLYCLKVRLFDERRGDLEIGPLRIRLLPFDERAASDNALGPTDPLREYYLDPSPLEHTTEEEVAGMLESFWARFEARTRREEALTALELRDPVDTQQIKRQYRRLTKEHHPDRGGDPERIIRINQAMDILEPDLD